VSVTERVEPNLVHVIGDDIVDLDRPERVIRRRSESGLASPEDEPADSEAPAHRAAVLEERVCELGRVDLETHADGDAARADASWSRTRRWKKSATPNEGVRADRTSSPTAGGVLAAETRIARVDTHEPRRTTRGPFEVRVTGEAWFDREPSAPLADGRVHDGHVRDVDAKREGAREERRRPPIGWSHESLVQARACARPKTCVLDRQDDDGADDRDEHSELNPLTADRSDQV